jgi:hypothetical protein
MQLPGYAKGLFNYIIINRLLLLLYHPGYYICLSVPGDISAYNALYSEKNNQDNYVYVKTSQLPGIKTANSVLFIYQSH